MRPAALLLLLPGCFYSLDFTPAQNQGRPNSSSNPNPPQNQTLPPAQATEFCGRPATHEFTGRVTGSSMPPPISGGTLLVLADGHTAVAADPDRDRVWVVDLEQPSAPVREVLMGGAAEPGRLTEGPAGTVSVALRRAGRVVTLDPHTGAVTRSVKVCSEPRGLVWDPAIASLHIACASGELVTLPDGAAQPSRVLWPGGDLRDVVLSNGHLKVTRFRSTDVLEFDQAGDVVATLRPAVVTTALGRRQPAVAWRAVAVPNGELVMVHQVAQIEPLDITCTNTGWGAAPISGVDAGPPAIGAALTTVGPLGRVALPLPLGVLPVDIAVADDCSFGAVVSAGSGEVTTLSAPFDGGCGAPAFTTGGTWTVPEPIAVALDGQHRVIVQSRQPAGVHILSGASIPFPAADLNNTGHQLFHHDTGRGIACASCHPEARDDGLTWAFTLNTGQRSRRTPQLSGGLSATAPFHWDGAFPNMQSLWNEVFVGRMGGPALPNRDFSVAANWLDSVPAPVAAVRDAPAAQRGKALFESTQVGCKSCHSGAHLTNNTTVNVGTGGSFQVPSLNGVASRAPYLHTGCAATLRDRFTNATCGGGEQHGHTAQLSAAELGDLIAYLETL